MNIKGFINLPNLKPFISKKKDINNVVDNRLLFVQLLLNEATLIHNSKLLKEIDVSKDNFVNVYVDKITGLTECPDLNLIFFQFWEFLSKKNLLFIDKTIYVKDISSARDVIYSLNEYNYTKNKLNPQLSFITPSFIPGLEKIQISSELNNKYDFHVSVYPNNIIIDQLTFIEDFEFAINNLNLNGDLLIYQNINSNILLFLPLLLYFFETVSLYNSELYEPYPYDVFIHCNKLKMREYDFVSLKEILKNNYVSRLYDYNNRNVINYVNNLCEKRKLYIKKIEDTYKLINILPKDKITKFAMVCIKSQISNGMKWCDKYNISLNRYYTIFENDPVLVNVTDIFAKKFPPNDFIDKSKLQMTDIGIYSYTPYYDTEKMIDYVKTAFDKLENLIITESNGGVGGDTVTFAKYFKKVNCFENRPLHCDIIRNNVSVYGFNNVTVYCWDYTDAMNEVEQDILYMDPPWGGPAYRLASKMSLYINNYSVEEIILKINAKLYILKAPLNFDIEKLLKEVNPTYIKVLDLKKYQVFFLKK